MKELDLAWAAGFFDGDGYYIWQLSSEDSIKTLRVLIPYLVLKRNEALAALRFEDLMVGRGGNISKSNRSKREKLYIKIKKFKGQYKGNDQWKN